MGPQSLLTVLLGLLCCAAVAAPGARLGDLTWPDAERLIGDADAVILPFAAGAKEHGPHLPMNADEVVMEFLLARAIESQRVIVAPPILHGWFPSFRDFPGTEVSDPSVFQQYVFLVAMSLVKQGARRIVFLNTGIIARSSDRRGTFFGLEDCPGRANPGSYSTSRPQIRQIATIELAW